MTIASTARFVSDATVIRTRASSNSITAVPRGTSSRCTGGACTTWAKRTTDPAIVSSRRRRDAHHRRVPAVNPRPCCISPRSRRLLASRRPADATSLLCLTSRDRPIPPNPPGNGVFAPVTQSLAEGPGSFARSSPATDRPRTLGNPVHVAEAGGGRLHGRTSTTRALRRGNRCKIPVLEGRRAMWQAPTARGPAQRAVAPPCSPWATAARGSSADRSPARVRRDRGERA